MKIVLASKSQIKISAVKQMLENENIAAVLTGVDVDSGVPMQPLNDETIQGARHRLVAAKQSCPDADIYIAIENGLFCERNAAPYFDKAIILVSTYDGPEIIAESAALQFPEQFVELIESARKIGFDKTTVGKELAKAGYIKQHDDFHFELSNKSRAAYLVEALLQLSGFFQQTILYKQPSDKQPLVINNEVLADKADRLNPFFTSEQSAATDKIYFFVQHPTGIKACNESQTTTSVSSCHSSQHNS